MANRSIPERGSWLLREIMYDLASGGVREWLLAAVVALGGFAVLWLMCAWAAM